MNTDLGDPGVLKPLEQTTMPAWLVAPSELATVREALRRCVPDLIDGTLAIEACKPMLRLKGKKWWATYEATVRDRAGARVVTLSGVLSPPRGSILITSAPRSARIIPQVGPMTIWVNSITRKPSSGSALHAGLEVVMSITPRGRLCD